MLCCQLVIAAMVVCTVVQVGTNQCYAYAGDQMQISIPVSYSVRGGRDTTGEFVLHGIGDAPMPAGAGNSQTLTVKAGETGEFGPITYDTPGEYNYEISRNDNPDENIETDNHIYQIQVAALNDGNVSKVIVKSGQEAKTAEVAYRDIYRRPAKEGKSSAPTKSGAAPATGDTSRIVIYAAAGVVCLLIVSAVRRIRRRDREGGERR